MRYEFELLVRTIRLRWIYNLKMNNPKPQAKDTFDISWIQKQMKCWVYLPNENEGDIYRKGIVKGIVPLSINKANSRVSGVLDNGASFEAKANQLEKCRDSNSLERDLIEMDIINAPEVLIQLKRRLAERKIHTYLWNSLIIVNPFKLIQEQYSQKSLSAYFEHIFARGEDIRKQEPHIFSFMFQILANLDGTAKTQVISISGQSGSGKTQTNKQALKAISYCCGRVQNTQYDKSSLSNMESRVLKCDPILQVFGNAKTIKNDNSSRFGKLVTLKINSQSMKIYHSSIKNYFLEKSRIISQSPGQRNFHIFYQFVSFLTEEQRTQFRMKTGSGYVFKTDDFNYLTQKIAQRQLQANDREMWDSLNQAFVSLDFSKDTVNQIWSIVASILLLGNITFDSSNQSQNEPCDIRNTEISDSVAFLLGIDRKQFTEALVTHRRIIAGQTLLSPLNERQCLEGRDSMAKAMYESLFQWLVQQLNRKLNVAHPYQENVRLLKLLDIYGFQVFDHNSFEQLCVNYTNEKIHQIYLEQVFIHEKNTLKKEGLESVISRLTFTDNIKIIELIDSLNKSIFNLLDESCSVNVKDDDFLANVRKHHDQHEHFPPSNLVNLRKSFIIKHTPGDIEYMADGFRDKNKDLIREDILTKLSNVKVRIISQSFRQRAQVLKSETNKRFLGIKIRRQVKELIMEMSTNTDLHFIRCIKPNEKKEPFLFVDRVCYNQIKYLGILDTIQMRKESYHIRIHYPAFYQKYGILENKLSLLISMSEGKVPPAQSKEIVTEFVNNQLISYNLDYLFGRERIFMKMATKNVLDLLLHKKIKFIEHASTMIKVHYRRSRMTKRRSEIVNNTLRIQKAVRDYLKIVRQLKKKKAVRVIQKAWIKYHTVFFARKKRPHLMVFQKYLKTRKEELYLNNKIQVIRRAKFLMMNLALSNGLAQKVEDYQTVKKELLGGIYDQIWQKMTIMYRNNIEKYFRGASVIRKNARAISKAQQSTNYRLNIKYRRYLQKYLRGYLERQRFVVRMASILKIQSWFRMLRVKRKYQSLRDNVIMIQRNWRKYYYDKEYNLGYTHGYFNDNETGKSIELEQGIWKQKLFRDYGKSSRNKDRSIEKLLFEYERIKVDKIGLFYYLLDFQILSPLETLYPNQSWIQNYLNLYEQAWSKGNPIQMIDVSDQHTICCTLNKVYTWGDYTLEDLTQNNPKKWNTIQGINLPPVRIEKVHAHNKFTVIQIENEDPIVAGEQKLYEEDSSSKQWKTLNESYVLINGVLLTLKKVNFSRVQISEKIVQLSCGMNHCIAKTSLRKVYTWGDNSKGQLGFGHYIRVKKPKIMDYLNKTAVNVQQVAASAYGCIVIDVNSRLYWWGTNGSIKGCTVPQQCYLFEKSEFIENSQKYTPVRILTTWSKSLSIIGLTIGSHEGIFKSAQNNIKRKTYENLIGKWNENIHTITPPYIQAISGYFQEKLMPKARQPQENTRLRDQEHQRIKEKLLAEIMLMQEAQRTLLKEKKKY